MQDEVGGRGKMGFRGYWQLSLQFGETGGIGYISSNNFCGTTQPQWLSPASEPQHFAPICLTSTTAEARALSPLSSCLGCISFLSWRRTRGVNSSDWGGGGRTDLVEWCLETTLRCKAENVASNFFHPPQMLAGESIYHTLSNLP